MSTDTVALMVALAIVGYLIIAFWRQVLAVLFTGMVAVFLFGLVEMVALAQRR